MPIYEYLCENCGHEFETLQKVSDAPLRECPKCQQERLVKKITAAGFRLKGGGWYETDFKKSGSKRNVAGDSGSSGSGEASSTGGGSSSSAGSDSGGGSSGGSSSGGSSSGGSKAASAD